MLRLLIALSLPLVAKDLTLEIPERPNPVKVSLPENFDPAKKHPTFFFYYGASGRPTTELMRTHSGGFSLGGWHTDLMLQAEPTIAGGIIIGAGHAQNTPGAQKNHTSQKPVHIAIGRSDPNYLYALKALTQTPETR